LSTLDFAAQLRPPGGRCRAEKSREGGASEPGGPVAVGALATKYSFHAAIRLLASIYFLDIIATLFLIPELKGKALD
jgi:hypothetical protein